MKPKLRFKEFSDEWCETTLGETTTFKQGIQVDVDKQFSKPFDNSVRFIRIVDYTQNTKDIRYISKPANANYVDEHDVVLVRYGATAGFVGHGIKGVIANNMFTVTPNSNINKDFLYTILKQDKIYNKLNSSNGSSAMPALNFGSVSILKFSYPSIDEQNKLTNLIYLLDKKIELQSKKIEDLKLFKSSQIKYILNKSISNEFPLKDLGYFISGNSFGKDKITQNGEPVVLYGDLYTKYDEEINCVEQFVEDNPKYIKSEIGDLLFPTSTTVDAISLISPSVINVSNVVYGGDLIIFKSNKDLVNPTFLSYQINHLKKKEFSKRAQGSTIIHISSEALLNSKVKIPSIEIQNSISNFGTFINNKINLEIEKLDKLNELKKGLMQNMFV